MSGRTQPFIFGDDRNNPQARPGAAAPGVSAAPDTIYALSTAAGRAGVAVFRLSGPDCHDLLRDLTDGTLHPPRVVGLTTLRHPSSGEVLDRGLVVRFAAPASFTGEDMAELHVHGGPAVVAAVADALTDLNAADRPVRLAEPGEFARRAFENGKLDLTAAEGIADLVAAETEAQRRQALRQMDGALGVAYDGWRDRLLTALAHVEAAIDFSEEDLPEGLIPQAHAVVADVAAELRAHLDDGHRGERLRDGVSVVIVGPPNVGKSTLLNALARRDVAIVSDAAGTTRDLIEVHLDLGGLPVILTDTAGLRTAAETVEAEGVRRARARAAAADIRLLMMDARDWPAIGDEVEALWDDDAILILNKLDLAESEAPAPPAPPDGRRMIALSAHTGAGLAGLVELLEAAARQCLAETASAPLTRARHRVALEDCCAALARARAAVLPELVAEDMRLAVRALGRITGRVDVEDILDVIFREFCIGK